MDGTGSFLGLSIPAVQRSAEEEEVDSWFAIPCIPALSSAPRRIPASTSLELLMNTEARTTGSNFQVFPVDMKFIGHSSQAVASNANSGKEHSCSIWTCPKNVDCRVPGTDISDASDCFPASNSLIPSDIPSERDRVSAKAAHKKRHIVSKSAKTEEAQRVPVKKGKRGRKPNPVTCFFCSEVVLYKRDFICHLREEHGIYKSQSLMYKRLKEGSGAIKQRYCKTKCVFKVAPVS